MDAAGLRPSRPPHPDHPPGRLDGQGRLQRPCDHLHRRSGQDPQGIAPGLPTTAWAACPGASTTARHRPPSRPRIAAPPAVSPRPPTATGHSTMRRATASASCAGSTPGSAPPRRSSAPTPTTPTGARSPRPPPSSAGSRAKATPSAPLTTSTAASSRPSTAPRRTRGWSTPTTPTAIC